MPDATVAVPFWLLLAAGGLWLLTVASLAVRLRCAPRRAGTTAADDAGARLEALETQLQEALTRLKVAARTAEEAEQASKAKSSFLAKMSHELRTPLSAIIGFAELIEQQAMGPIGNARYTAYATDIRESGEHVLGIINDILDLSKVEAGKETLQEQDIAVEALVAGVRILVEGRARDAGVQLIFDCPANLPGIRCDKRRLTQILVNLLSNGIKFTPEGGTVTLRGRTTPGGGLAFEASDTGIGIAPADVPTALSVFGQIDHGTKLQAKGTGLGLPLAKALAELHGGTLELASEPGRGTTVTLQLPARRVLAQPFATAAARSAPQRAAG